MSIALVSPSTSNAAALVQQVDFPEFVSGLIEGVFHAVVDASIEQAQAYEKMTGDDSTPLISRLAAMGINRIVVTDGKG